MMTIYIDEDFKCHLENDGTMKKVQTHYFDCKCTEYIEGFRFVPSNESWTREDGVVFFGEMVTPWKPFSELEVAQRKYEQELASAALILLGGN